MSHGQSRISGSVKIYQSEMLPTGISVVAKSNLQHRELIGVAVDSLENFR